ncbi:MAG: sigma-70 family RNA polymerase sigma factor [Gemmatimonadaceae bacterium]|nr:sigma-70 family RNA polymerase sigma factor [Gemmatimonadaceae bacterium]
MPESIGPSLTALLRAAQEGVPGAQDEAAAVVYDELRQLAAVYLGRERGDHTLQPTALVHEAYLRLLGQDTPWRNRSHFFGIAAQMMRRVLVDHARRGTAERRDRGSTVRLDDAGPLALDDGPDAQAVLDVHEALGELERMDPRQAQVVELKFFVGLSLDEIADVIGISAATVSREWTLARRWLQHRLRSA